MTVAYQLQGPRTVSAKRDDSDDALHSAVLDSSGYLDHHGY